MKRGWHIRQHCRMMSADQASGLGVQTVKIAGTMTHRSTSLDRIGQGSIRKAARQIARDGQILGGEKHLVDVTSAVC